MFAELFHGNPVMIDHTPVGAIAAGQGVLIGTELHIAHRAIAAGELGALATPSGNAVYKIVKKAAETFAVDDDVEVHIVNQEADSAGTAAVGLTCVKTAASADGFVFARHG